MLGFGIPFVGPYVNVGNDINLESYLRIFTPVRPIEEEERKMMILHRWAHGDMSAFLHLSYLICRSSELNEPIMFDLIFTIISGTGNR